MLANSENSPYGKFILKVIKCCELANEMKENDECDKYIKKYLYKYKQSSNGLKVRDALNGGRTNAISHNLCPIPTNHNMYYYDFTSLYPAVQFSINGEKYPLGFPDIYIASELDRAPLEPEWFGFVKLAILPPQDLFHPVLGQVVNGKYIFHNCTTCVKLAVSNKPILISNCNHNDSERLILGTFFTEEINLAVEYGYQIVEKYELWHWPKSRQSTDLFKEMIKSQYIKKALASPLPMCADKLKQMLCEYKEKMGLDLSLDMFKENPTMRLLSKFILNNIWGYLGKRCDYEETEFVTKFSRYLNIMDDKNKEITRLFVVNNGKAVLITWKPLKESLNKTGNVALASCVTSYARIALYKIIAKYPINTVYFDTDSIILLLPKFTKPLLSSNILGGLKDEIFESYGPDAAIGGFCSLGPKVYYYFVVKNGLVVDEVIKFKGINFNNKVNMMLTKHSMLQMIHKRDVMKIEQYGITKNLFKTLVSSYALIKKVQFQSNKRIIWASEHNNNNTSMTSIPFGFKGKRIALISNLNSEK